MTMTFIAVSPVFEVHPKDAAETADPTAGQTFFAALIIEQEQWPAA